jgi:hypothetical protein
MTPRLYDQREGGAGPDQSATAEPGGKTAVLLDYWLAYRLRFLALRARWTRAQDGRGDWPEACAQVADGREVSPRDRVRAQIFATRIWYRCALASLVVLLGNGFLGLAFPKGHQRDLVLDISLIWLFIAVIAIAEAGSISWRLSWTRRFVQRGGLGLDAPDYLLRRGRPRRRDFWVAAVVAVVVVAALLWLSVHPSG